MRSFFQEFEKDDDGSIIRCKMHDIVHDVAQYLSKNECYMIEVKDFGEQNIYALCEKALQLRLIVTGNNTIPISICNFKKLRSLLIECDSYAGSKLSSKVVTKLCDELSCLKALAIVGNSGLHGPFKHIPKEIGRLVHLSNLKELPQGIGKLINLRHLINIDTYSLSYMPKGIERLTCFRTLTEFHSHGDVYGGKACPLECLNNFRHLESIAINMNWSDLKIGCRLIIVTMNDEAILETFQPSQNLQRLEIVYYKGFTMSSLRRMTSLTNLRSIKLYHCKKCLHLPPLGKLPSLETLVIERMYSVREVGNEFLGVESGEASSSSSSIIYFPNLKTLHFDSMREWEVWDFGNEDDTCTIMPSLRSLQIQFCHKLKGLPKQLLHQMAPLQNLEIRHCSILEEVYEKGKGDKWQDISHIPNIKIWSWR
ncbi:hypothetical protein LWI28_015568 [Acer negundo]|uniref:R13L1/DRL21-like LRR repeat region domain-containing protein n=1 Tax=Acer negundo TaxID=4023 RepID=A0AAD5IF43_ACENE|nr:hypothetical protein LWI28_015568 [Acer negundo]